MNGKDGKYLSIFPKKMGKKRFRRTAQLGEEYTKERLEQRIYEEKKRKGTEYKIQNQRKYKKKFNMNVQGIQKRIILFIWRGQKYKMTDPEIQIDHFIMIKRNIFDRQCIYNPEDIIKNHRLYKEIRNYGNWRKRHKK